jgi:hypothetical protein
MILLRLAADHSVRELYRLDVLEAVGDARVSRLGWAGCPTHAVWALVALL